MNENIFRKRLKELLEEKQISQKELANAIQTTEVSISRYMSGDRQPKIYIVQKIAEYLNISSDYLLGITDSHTQQKNDDVLYATNINKDYTKLSKDEQESIKKDVENYADYVIRKHFDDKK